MSVLENWALTDQEKEDYITAITPDLLMLRAKAGVSQDELSCIIGVSRQTYGFIERKRRRMTWNTYLSLICFYDNLEATHDMFRNLPAYPHDLLKNMDFSGDANGLAGIFGSAMGPVFEKLDAQAFHSIRTFIMVEYARCTKTSGDAVIKAFDGANFDTSFTSEERTAAKALHHIRKGRRSVDKQ